MIGGNLSICFVCLIWIFPHPNYDIYMHSILFYSIGEIGLIMIFARPENELRDSVINHLEQVMGPWVKNYKDVTIRKWTGNPFYASEFKSGTMQWYPAVRELHDR